jgi:3-phosphoshikimate 1-carboxyvinyltransferase
MESILIQPINHALNATVRVPGSKSLTNRAMLIAALANGSTRLTNALFSDDSIYFAEALQKLGFDINLDRERCEISVHGQSGRIPAQKVELFVGNSGTAARFLSAFLTLGNGEFLIDGDARMRERPIGDLVSTLTTLGAHLEPLSHRTGMIGTDVCPPIKIISSGLPGGTANISGNVSSQFLSALLMVAPYAQHPVELNVSTDLNSKPYVDMTINVMSEFGVKIFRDGYKNFKINTDCYQQVDTFPIEPDASAASYFFAAAAILGGCVRIENITRKSKQGDIAFVDVLQKMGCSVVEGFDYIEVIAPASPKRLQGVDVDMRDIPDTAQTLAVIAPFASTPSHIHGIASARVKESDRISATCLELARLGVRVEEHQDGMSIFPSEIFTPTSIKTYKDHRMAMSFALIGLRVEGVNIEDSGCVSKTFPAFFSTLESLR